MADSVENMTPIEKDDRMYRIPKIVRVSLRGVAAWINLHACGQSTVFTNPQSQAPQSFTSDERLYDFLKTDGVKPLVEVKAGQLWKGVRGWNPNTEFYITHSDGDNIEARVGASAPYVWSKHHFTNATRVWPPMPPSTTKGGAK